MEAGWMAAITAILSIIAILLEAWAKNSPTREKEEKDDAIEQGRRDLSEGNVDAVAARIDRLLRSEDDRAAGRKDSENKAGGTSAV